MRDDAYKTKNTQNEKVTAAVPSSGSSGNVQKAPYTYNGNSSGNTPAGGVTASGGGNLLGVAVPQRSSYNSADAYKQKYDELAKTPYEAKYTGDYMRKMNDLIDTISQSKFTYNPESDPAWLAAKDSYIRGGRTAMADTVGRAAALNGGYGTSYAETAGQQMYNKYMQDLASLQPEYEDRAYGRYSDELNRMYQLIDTYGSLDNIEYSRDRDARGDYESDLDRALSTYMTFRGIDDSDFERDYGIYADQRSAALEAQKLYDSERQQQLENLIAMGNYDALENMGYDTSALRETAKDGGDSISPYTYNDGENQEFMPYTFAGEDTTKKKTDADGEEVYTNNIYYRDGKQVSVAKGINPYTGTMNADTKTNGKYDPAKTFSNGYQPNNINGKKLTKTGFTDEVNGVTENVWKTSDGKMYIWDGTKNKYMIYEV